MGRKRGKGGTVESGYCMVGEKMLRLGSDGSLTPLDICYLGEPHTIDLSTAQGRSNAAWMIVGDWTLSRGLAPDPMAVCLVRDALAPGEGFFPDGRILAAAAWARAAEQS